MHCHYRCHGCQLERTTELATIAVGRLAHGSLTPRTLSPAHPQNPALAGQNIYQSKEVQDKQIVRLIGKIPTLAALAYHRASGRKPAQPNQNLGYTEVRRRVAES